MLGQLTDKQLLWRGRQLAKKRARLSAEHAAAIDALRAIWQEGQRRGITSREVAEHTDVSEGRVRREWVA